MTADVFAVVANCTRTKSIQKQIVGCEFLLEIRESFKEQKDLTPTGLAWDTNMAAVLLFGDNNMADVKSCETALSVKCKTVLAIASKEWL